MLEAGGATGFMVYAPLHPEESYHVEHEGDGRYTFMYFLEAPSGTPTHIFTVTIALSIGAVGMTKEEVVFTGVPTFSREEALNIMRVCVVPEDMATPAGAIALRGATNFRTPAGWDTIYTPIFNMIERPVAPMLVVRVETDWYAHETECRYVLQPTEGMTVQRSLPIWQVCCIHREEITLRDCTDVELEKIRRSQMQFAQDKADATQRTSYGLSVSPHYLRQSRARKP